MLLFVSSQYLISYPDSDTHFGIKSKQRDSDQKHIDNSSTAGKTLFISGKDRPLSVKDDEWSSRRMCRSIEKIWFSPWTQRERDRRKKESVDRWIIVNIVWQWREGGRKKSSDSRRLSLSPVSIDEIYSSLYRPFEWYFCSIREEEF